MKWRGNIASYTRQGPLKISWAHQQSYIDFTNSIIWSFSNLLDLVCPISLLSKACWGTALAPLLPQSKATSSGCTKCAPYVHFYEAPMQKMACFFSAVHICCFSWWLFILVSYVYLHFFDHLWVLLKLFIVFVYGFICCVCLSNLYCQITWWFHYMYACIYIQTYIHIRILCTHMYTYVFMYMFLLNIYTHICTDIDGSKYT